ncbi:SubName: Full=Uncharacterized protein {ECO:0000313/EMBL:CCA75896.1} [Serendipita indica DSM 11827]|nr:SubName: Full=Uncharacterized protein {ECO:0000313/EMBL:CCA75896.1} [Serendipita indica DSM 11827]
MPSIQAEFQRLVRILKKSTVNDRAGADRFIDTAGSMVEGSTSRQVIDESAEESTMNLVRQTTREIESTVSPSQLPSNPLDDPQFIANAATQQTRIFDRAYNICIKAKKFSNHLTTLMMIYQISLGAKDATALKQKERKSKDQRRMSRILGRASQYPVSPITANTADLDLLEMNDYDEENIIKLARDRFPSGVSIKQHLIQRYKARFPGTHLAFKLWHELAGSPCGISKRFWQIIRDQQGEIPITYSRIYFVNVALPDGQLASKLYTVVTVSLNKQEKPLALGELPSSTVYTGVIELRVQRFTSFWYCLVLRRSV